MLKIREFAKLCNTTEKTLRFYDRVGVLKAEYIHPDNGYRYYSRAQIEQYNRIVELKEVGFTLEEIRSRFLDADNETILRHLREKEQAMLESYNNCRKMIEIYEEREKMTDTTKPKLMIHRYPEKNEITLDDGNRYVTYPCSASVMKPCCRMLEEIFNSPWYINLDFADLPAPTDKNRPILYRETVAESKETLPDDAERLYASAEALKEANCVLIFMELSPDVDLETTEEVSCRIWDYVDENATILWASTFTHDISYRISLIGIY
jgi:DNA-binding transcriptional MerR regulator